MELDEVYDISLLPCALNQLEAVLPEVFVLYLSGVC